MPAVANPITFSPTSGQPITFADLPVKGNKRLPTKGIPSYGYTVGSTKPFRPGVGLTSGNRGTVSSGYTVPTYNVMENAGMNEYGSYDMPGTGDQIAEMLKGTVNEGLIEGGIGTLGAALTGRNLTGVDLGDTPILGEIPGIGTGLKWLDYKLDPSWANAKDLAGGWGRGTGKYIVDYPGEVAKWWGDTLTWPANLATNLGAGIAGLTSSVGFGPPLTTGTSAVGSSTGAASPGILFNTQGQPVQVSLLDAAKAGSNKLFGTNFNVKGNNIYTGNKIGGPGGEKLAVDNPYTTLGDPWSKTYKGVGGFFNQPRTWITGQDKVGLFGKNVGNPGISSIGNVLGTVGGTLSLIDFIDDPSLASGLGTLAGFGASGIPGIATTTTAAGATSATWLATAAPWLAGAALVASLLMNKKPSNKTGYTSIDLDEFKPVSFGMEGKKYSKENVDQTSKIMEPIIPLIQQLEEQYGVDLQGDIQINYGGRDGLAYNIGNRDVTGFRNRLDYFDGRDQSTRDGGSIFRKTFKGENAGKDFYKSLLGDLETLAKQKQAEGGGVIDLSGYRGVQRQIPQGAFSYGLPGGSGSSGNITAGGAPAATQPKGKQGVFSWGYGD